MVFRTHPIKFLIKQYTAKSVASLRPRSGLILGSMTCGDAASARTSGVAALMAGAAHGRVPDACGAIVAGSSRAALQHSTGTPGTRHPLHRTEPERANSTRVRTREKHARHTSPSHQSDREGIDRVERRRVCALSANLYGLR